LKEVEIIMRFVNKSERMKSRKDRKKRIKSEREDVSQGVLSKEI
jgi:hypothetical protein